MSKQVVEINGTKFEVDLSTATKVEEFKVGDRVKVLEKKYSDSYKIHAGVIIGFDWFETHPTITIAYLDISYSAAEIKFLYYNDATKDIEISHSNNEELFIEPADVIKKLDKEVTEKQNEIRDIQQKKEYFIKNFGEYFKEFQSELLEQISEDASTKDD